MFTLTLVLPYLSNNCSDFYSYGAYSKALPSPSGPTINDESLTVEKVVSGLTFPTSMTFVGEDDILVTEKNTGQVKRILDGQIQDSPLIDLSVATKIERGLLGIAASKHPDGKTFVFLSYTESGNEQDGSDVKENVDPLGNRLYRYDYIDGQLVNPVLLLDLTAIPNNINRTDHNGGKLLIGPDNNVYMIIGEVGGHRTQAQNIENGPAPNGLGGVLRITQDGQEVDNEPIFGSELPLSIYYAMGIRNSFGIDFDPLTGNLWDTENGPTSGDEINLVFPGFNSGWSLIQGFSEDDLLVNVYNYTVLFFNFIDLELDKELAFQIKLIAKWSWANFSRFSSTVRQLVFCLISAPRTGSYFYKIQLFFPFHLLQFYQ